MAAGVLIDLDGVVYQNNQVIAGAAQTIEWLESQRIPYLFVTNTTSRPRRQIVRKLAAFGIATSAERILTPPIAAVQWLRAQKLRRIALYVPQATRDDFADFDEVVEPRDEVDAVVLGDLGETWTFQILNRAFNQLVGNPSAHLITLGMTRFWRAPEGLQLDVGPFAKALSYAASREPVVLGKPSRDYFHTAAEALGLDPALLLMIGDDVRSDVLAATEAGLRGVLVQTGKFRPGDLELVDVQRRLPSLAALPDCWQSLVDS